MTVKMLLFASLLAVAAMATSAAQSSTDVPPDTTLNRSEDETKPENATKPGARRDHAAERLDVPPTPAKPPSRQGFGPEESRKRR